MKNVKKYKRGQGMTEYLIIVALIAVGTIGMVRTVGKNVQAGFGTVANALHGKKQKVETDAVDKDAAKKRTMGDFNTGVAGNNNDGGLF